MEKSEKSEKTSIRGYVHCPSITLEEIESRDIIEYRNAFYLIRDVDTAIAKLNGVYTFSCNQITIERTEITEKAKFIVSVVIGPESLMIKKLFIIYKPTK